MDENGKTKVFLNLMGKILHFLIVAIFALSFCYGIYSMTLFLHKKYLTNIDLFDCILLLILAITLVLKLARDIIVPHYIRYLEYASDRECRFLIQNNEGDFWCENLRYYKRHFAKSGRCPRQRKKKCPGFRALGASDKNGEVIKGEDIFYSSPAVSIFMSIIDWIIQLSTVLLVIRTLMGKD